MKRIYYLGMLLLISMVSLNAQVTIGDNTDPHSGALLELKGDKGLLLPRVSLDNARVFQLSEDAATAEGTMVYNTNADIEGGYGVGLYVWEGNKWFKITDSRKNSCGAYIHEGVWLPFMCHNLGANESADPFTPSAAIHGAKYPWGSKEPIMTQAEDQAYPTTPAWWSGSVINPDGSWSDSYKTENDPCPDGWRLPTREEWVGVVANNTTSFIGDWTDSADNYSSGVYIGNYLFLPAAGHRNPDGTQFRRGYAGFYWSTKVEVYLYFDGFSSTLYGTGRAFGMPVRCVAEYY